MISIKDLGRTRHEIDGDLVEMGLEVRDGIRAAG